MSYAKQFPIRITLTAKDCTLLIEGLKDNENDFTGYIANDAKSLREKIEQLGRRETDADGGEVVRLGFFENEGKKFIRQFLAAAIIAKDLQAKIAIHEYLAELSENLISKYKRLIEMNESVIEKQERLLELCGMKITDDETESEDNA